MQRLGLLARAISADRRGSVALIFGITSMVLLGMTGLAVDGARIYSVSSRVGSALDAAALAGAAMLNQTNATDSDVQNAAISSFNAHLAEQKISGISLSNQTVTPDRPNSAVTVSVDISAGTIFGVFAGVPTVNYTKSSTSTYQLARLEVVLSLDITGSMNQIPAGDTQPKITTLQQVATSVVNSLYDMAMTDTNIRIGVVPWSSSVNVGPYFDLATGTQPNVGWNYGYWWYTPQTNTCVIERPGLTAGTPGTTDVVPGTLAYSGVFDNPPGYVCPTAGIAPLIGRTQRANMLSIISGLTAGGGTAGHIGTAWAWYMISPYWASYWPSDSGGDNYGTSTIKNVIILSDGIFNTDYVNGDPPQTRPQYDDTSYSLFQLNCAGMRAAGINVYTILFDLSDARAVTEMQNCAGSPNNFFNPTNSTQLSTAFQSIIKKMTTVRVSK